MHIGGGRHERAVLGTVTWLRHGPAPLARGGQTFVLQDAKEIGFADGMAFGVQLPANLGQCAALAAQAAGAVADGLAFASRLVRGRGGTEEAAEVGVVSEVAHQGADRVHLQLKAFGHFVRREVLDKVGPTNLIVSLGGGLGMLKQTGEFLGTCHGSWGWLRQVARCQRQS
jgi:hypothetical protein